MTARLLQLPAPPPVPPPPTLPVQDIPTPAPPLDWYQAIPPQAVVLIVLAGIAGGALILWPLVRALARRLEGKTFPEPARRELDELREQVAELEGMRIRMHELEERVDFTERLLAQHRVEAQLPPGGTR